MNHTISISSRVHNYIVHHDSEKQPTFTAHDVAAMIGNETELGGITSTLARARKAGLISLVGTKQVNPHRKAFEYAILDNSLPFRTLKKPGQGGKAGAARKKHKRAKPPSQQHVIERDNPQWSNPQSQEANRAYERVMERVNEHQLKNSYTDGVQPLPLHEAMLELASRLESAVLLADATDAELLAEMHRRLARKA